MSFGAPLRLPRASLAALALVAVAIAAGSDAVAARADGHQAPRVALELTGLTSHRYNSLGEWWGPGCAPIAIDPAPRSPRGFPAPRGRHTLRVVYATPLRPVAFRVRAFDARGEGGRRRAALRPRRDEGGDVVAWVLRFRARLGRELDVFAAALWEDRGGCGLEHLEVHFPLRGD